MDAESEATSESPAGPLQHGGVDMSDSSGAYELVLSGVIFGLIGWWLDSRFDTAPIFVIVFSVLGIIGAGLSLYYRFKYRIAQIHAETAKLKAAQKSGQP